MPIVGKNAWKKSWTEVVRFGEVESVCILIVLRWSWLYFLARDDEC